MPVLSRIFAQRQWLKFNAQASVTPASTTGEPLVAFTGFLMPFGDVENQAFQPSIRLLRVMGFYDCEYRPVGTSLDPSGETALLGVSIGILSSSLDGNDEKNVLSVEDADLPWLFRMVRPWARGANSKYVASVDEIGQPIVGGGWVGTSTASFAADHPNLAVFDWQIRDGAGHVVQRDNVLTLEMGIEQLSGTPFDAVNVVGMTASFICLVQSPA